MNKITLIPLAIAFAVTACGGQVEKEKSDEEKQAELEMKKSPEYVAENALPAIDDAIKKAIEEKDFRLFGIAGRGVSLPGISAEKLDEVKAQCGFKPMPGYKDNFKTKEERQALKKLRDYAKSYNEKMYQFCLKSQ